MNVLKPVSAVLNNVHARNAVMISYHFQHNLKKVWVQAANVRKVIVVKIIVNVLMVVGNVGLIVDVWTAGIW